MTTLRDYLSGASSSIYYQNGDGLSALISVAISYDELKLRANFPVPSKFDLQVIPDTKWQNVFETYLQLLKMVFRSDLAGSFELAVLLLENLNRCAEKQDNWILPAMFSVDKELRTLYQAKHGETTDNGSKISQLNHSIATAGRQSSLERMARVISTSFQICLNDRNSEIEKSKRQGVYFFIGELFKIYSSLQKYDLARSTEKLFGSLRHELPLLNNIMKSHAVTYLYFSGSISCSEDNLASAHEKLTKLLDLCPSHGEKSQITSILLLLIPIMFLQTRRMPSEVIWRTYPEVKLVYYNIFIALKRGDLKLFDYEFQKIERIVLKRQLYLIMMRLRSFVMLKLFKKTWLAIDKKPHIPISAFQIALEFSISHASAAEEKFKYSLDATESQVAKLISSGYIKGYLSHGNRVAVLSKLDPFPKQVV